MKWTWTQWGETITIRDEDEPGLPICRINANGNINSGIPTERDAKNARLICAAPEMLQLLKNHLRVLEGDEENNDYIQIGELSEFIKAIE